MTPAKTNNVTYVSSNGKTFFLRWPIILLITNTVKCSIPLHQVGSIWMLRSENQSDTGPSLKLGQKNILLDNNNYILTITMKYTHCCEINFGKSILLQDSTNPFGQDSTNQCQRESKNSLWQGSTDQFLQDSTDPFRQDSTNPFRQDSTNPFVNTLHTLWFAKK